MNKHATFLTAPVTSLFMRSVYDDAMKNSAWRGVLYQLYLSFLTVVLTAIVFVFALLPKIDDVAKWIGDNMPSLVWTPQGLSMEDSKVPQPYVMTHPKLGALAVFDMAKVDVTGDDLGRAYIYVTARKIFYKSAPGRLESRDLVPATPQGQGAPQRVRITGDIAVKFYENLKRTLMTTMAFVFLILIFIVFLMGSLLYSLVGLLFNLLRKNKLKYGKIFNVTCFATTIGLILSWLMTFTPLRVIGLRGWLITLINIGFIFLVMKITDREPGKN